jgi:hypothetical protein
MMTWYVPKVPNRFAIQSYLRITYFIPYPLAKVVVGSLERRKRKVKERKRGRRRRRRAGRQA